jgi:DNA-binding response OmpR family regulator
LINNSYTVDTAYNGETGSYMARTGAYDVVIIDYIMPDKNGISVCSEIRATGSTACIIFLSMNYTINNKVACLEAGADDYMTKPFSLEELNARIKALIRRPRIIESSILTCRDIVMDTKKQNIQRSNKSIYLTRTEYNILEFLIRNRGMILSRGMIMEHVWNAEADPFSNTIEAHITNIRRKIALPGDTDEIIRNITGRGYIIQ